MDSSRRAIRSLLFEQKLDPAFISTKAREENIRIANLSQKGLSILIHLKSPADEKAIRRFKNQLRIRNPRLDRIEVRQPESADTPETPEHRQEKVPYTEWRNKILDQLRSTSTDLGWNLYSDPEAGKETEYVLFIRGEGPNREIVRARISAHPGSLEKSELSFDMTGTENTIADLESRLKTQ